MTASAGTQHHSLLCKQSVAGSWRQVDKSPRVSWLTAWAGALGRKMVLIQGTWTTAPSPFGCELCYILGAGTTRTVAAEGAESVPLVTLLTAPETSDLALSPHSPTAPAVYLYLVKSPIETILWACGTSGNNSGRWVNTRTVSASSLTLPWPTFLELKLSHGCCEAKPRRRGGHQPLTNPAN